MKLGMLAAFFLSTLAFGVGMSQAPASDGPAPADHVLEADALQGSCGDGSCSPPEDCNTCPQDCGQCCGNRRCEPPEDCNSCPQDCRC